MINPEITVEEIIDCYEKIRCLGVVSREEAIATVSSIAASDIISAGNIDDDNKIKHYGHWIHIDGVFGCSECGYQFEPEGYFAFFNYCPNCGTEMNNEGS